MRVSHLKRRLRRELRNFSPGNRRLHRKESQLVARFLEGYWNELAARSGANCESLGDGFRRLSRDSRWTITYRGEVMIDSRVALRMAGNKILMYRLMRDWGLDCVTKHCLCSPDDMTGAVELLESGPLVTKPSSGTGGGRGVTTRIGSIDDLERGISIAADYDERVLVEEHIEANCYRLLYLDGILLDAIWRQTPSVMGDGKSTIDELVDAENRLRERSEELRALSLITKDREYDNQLRHLGHLRNDVLPRGTQVPIKHVVNQNNATENERVFDQVHATIAAKCAEICALAGLRFVGVDVLTRDIRESWDDQRVVVNELNTTPGLHHHVLTKTGSDDHRVGRALLQHLLVD